MALPILFWITTLFFVVAFYLSYKLSREVKGEHYWIFFSVAIIGFATTHFSTVPNLFGLDADALDTLHELGEIIGAFALAYASYGLYASLKHIRKRLAG
jgi:hypothetical protein